MPGVLLNLSGGSLQNMTTGGEGAFAFTASAGGNFTIVPTKSADVPPSQGVTTLDITLIRRHILGIAALNSPYKILAADVNNSSNVTTLDIALIRRVILGITNAFPSPMWRFVRSDFSFADPTIPWTHEAVRNYTSLTADAVNQDFIGIKLEEMPTPSEASVDGKLANMVLTPSRAVTTGEETLPPTVGIEVDRERGVVRVRVQTERGRSYVLQSKETLSSTGWQESGRIEGDGTVRVLEDARGLDRARFYRVIIE